MNRSVRGRTNPGRSDDQFCVFCIYARLPARVQAGLLASGILVRLFKVGTVMLKLAQIDTRGSGRGMFLCVTGTEFRLLAALLRMCVNHGVTYLARS